MLGFRFHHDVYEILVQETFDALVQMYSMLKEEDMWAGAWQKKAKYNETVMAIAYEQQGHFEQAQGAYELAMTKARQDANISPASPNLQSEYKLWEDHWIRFVLSSIFKTVHTFRGAWSYLSVALPSQF